VISNDSAGSPDLRRERRVAERLDDIERLDTEPEFRVDLERIRFSPYFSRLSAVTQVISQAGAGPVIHNRLTHSVKVTAVARSIAVTLEQDPGATGRLVRELGGCNPVVVQAAASAHDLGHPPFGHLGEQVLDRLAREHLGLTEGFEGNAQTFRIVTELDTCDASTAGLNLTAAVRSGLLKYPWLRSEWRAAPRASFRPGSRRAAQSIAPSGAQEARIDLPRGVGDIGPGGAQKFSAYSLNVFEMTDARNAFPEIAPWQQSVECAVMDIADDIAYSIHDLDDFYRAGVLQQAAVSAELRSWLRDSVALSRLDSGALESSARIPGHALELVRRRSWLKDAWIADDEAFRLAVTRVSDDLGDGLLAVPFDGSIAAERAIASFTRRWITRLQRSIVVERHPHVRSAHVRLDQQAWHDVVVLKFVHTRFVLERPDLATYQRGQGRVLETLVEGFRAWLDDEDDAARAPRRLIELIEVATAGYHRLRTDAPELLDGDASDKGLAASGRGRGILDYVASLTDSQAMSVASLISGTSDLLFEGGKGL
jgi:dGTPase